MNNPAELRSVATELLARFRQPVLVETYLPGREFTVGIVGTGDEARALGVMEIISTEKAVEHRLRLREQGALRRERDLSADR